MSDWICRFSGLLGVESFELKESITNWKLYGIFAFCLYNTAFMPNICAEDMEISSWNNGDKSIFAASRALRNISLPLLSYMETSSMMTRLSSPISTLPMLTLVPSSFSNTPQAIELIHFCTGGVFRDTAMARYNAASDHIVRTNIVLICFKRYSQSWFNLAKVLYFADITI